MSQPLRVMSFNIRYPEPADAANAWEHRRPLVASLIERYLPDVAGLQEPVLEQLQYLDAELPEYARFGVSRYGNEDEKFTAVYYCLETVELLDRGAFWLSETPDVQGSCSWLIHKPYAVNWAKLRHRPSGLEWSLFNTHFPYKPEQAEARLRAAKLLREQACAAGETSVLTGDFNSPAGGEVHRLLLEEFRDAWLEAPVRSGPEGTFHGFAGETSEFRRMDWILARGPVAIESCRAITDATAGRFPSDHFPVMADLRRDTSARTPRRLTNGNRPGPA